MTTVSPLLRSGKTSLLLHYAHARAASTGGNVLFVCRRDKIEASPPVLPLGIAVDDAALSRVHMRSAAHCAHDVTRPCPPAGRLRDRDHSLQLVSGSAWVMRTVHGIDMVQTLKLL